MTRIFYVTSMMALLFFSCKENHQEKTAAEAIAQPALGGELRGVSIGDDAEKVLLNDPGESLYEMPDQIVYRLPLHEGGNTWYEINYSLSENGVYDISLEIFPHDSLEHISISEDLLGLYLSKYGPAMKHDGFFTWKVMSDRDRVITVSLTDTLKDQENPIIRVHFSESK